jgi:hypothetical protein
VFLVMSFETRHGQDDCMMSATLDTCGQNVTLATLVMMTIGHH